MRLIRRLLILAIVGVAGVAAYAYWSGARDTEGITRMVDKLEVRRP